MKKVKLSEFVENPDNPQTVTDDRFKALVEKLRRNPNGLKADRIAYVTDNPAGKYVVLSGNKRLRALKEIYGPGGQVDAEWFQDITGMSEDERSEFIVSANVNEGKFDADKMLKLYDKDELKSWMGAEAVDQLIAITEAGPAQPDGGAGSGSDAGDGSEEPGDGTVELRIKLSSDDYERAVLFLRANGGSMEKRFMEVIRDHAKNGGAR